MTGADLAAWRARLKLNKSEAAATLGLSLLSYRRYERGKHPIPLYVALACSAVAHNLPPYGRA